MEHNMENKIITMPALSTFMLVINFLPLQFRIELLVKTFYNNFNLHYLDLLQFFFPPFELSMLFKMLLVLLFIFPVAGV